MLRVMIDWRGWFWCRGRLRRV